MTNVLILIDIKTKSVKTFLLLKYYFMGIIEIVDIGAVIVFN